MALETKICVLVVFIAMGIFLSICLLWFNFKETILLANEICVGCKKAGEETPRLLSILNYQMSNTGCNGREKVGREHQKVNVVCSDPGWLLGTQMEMANRKWGDSRNLQFLSTHGMVCMSIVLQKQCWNLVPKATVVEEWPLVCNWQTLTSWLANTLIKGLKGISNAPFLPCCLSAI